MSILYQYAQSDDGSVRHISQITVEYRKAHKLTCSGCGKKMEAVLNVSRTQPFYRHSGTKCSLETYLHQMGINLFKELFEKNRKLGVPLTVDYHFIHQCGVECCKYGCSQKCRSQDESRKYDLLTKFTDIEIEEKDLATGLVPDLLLSNAMGDKLYVEIYVTHPVTEEKKSTGVPLVQIKLKSEDDLKKFQIEDETTITNLQEFDIEYFNFGKEIIKEQPYCIEEMKRARDSFKEFYTRIIEVNGNFSISYDGEGKCGRDCRYFVTSRCLNGPSCSKINLAHSYRNVIDDECEYDCLVYQDEDSNKLRFAFSVGFSDEYKRDAIPTIQFALMSKNNIFSWNQENIVEKQRNSIAYHNFDWKNLWNCEKYEFTGFVLEKNGYCRLLKSKRIGEIYEEIRAMNASIEDYLIMGSS